MKLLAHALLFLFCVAPASAAELARRALSSAYTFQGVPVRVAFFDADSTLRISTGKHFAPATPAEVRILPNVPETIRELGRQGYLIAVVSNQENMIGRYTDVPILAAMHETIRQAEAAGGKVHYFDYSFTKEEAKPNPLMGERLEAQLKESFGAGASIDRKKSFMVGDAAYLAAENGAPADLRPDNIPAFDHGNFDRLFAKNLNVKFYEPDEFFGWREDGVRRFHRLPELEAYRAKHPSPVRKTHGCSASFDTIEASKIRLPQLP
jgi:DNA 3'-phosphatase